jgi:hypothetical protein
MQRRQLIKNNLDKILDNALTAKTEDETLSALKDLAIKSSKTALPLIYKCEANDISRKKGTDFMFVER